MSKNKTKEQSGGGRFARTVCVFVCVFVCGIQAGCGRADRALFFAAGETLTAETEASAEHSVPDDGRQSGEISGQKASEPENPPMIYVHVCGAVMNPGVVLLPEESRGQDALVAAGGFAQDAATDAVNLAERVYDGMKLYFPTKEEAQTLGNMAQAGGVETGEPGLVNINTADTALLCTLPGIGEARARAIVADREENGPFAGVEDIMRVSGIKESAYGKIKDLITVR